MSTIFQWFKDPAHAAFVASLLSALALVVSFLAYRTSRKTQRRMLAIEEARERDRLTQSRKANLTAQLCKQPTAGYPSFFLELHNQGPGEARDISLFLDGQPFFQHPVAPSGVQLPVQLGPKSQFRLPPLVIRMAKAGPFKLEITWSDDSGEPGVYGTTLTA